MDSISAAYMALTVYTGTWGTFKDFDCERPAAATPPTDHLGIDWFADDGLQIGVMPLD